MTTVLASCDQCGRDLRLRPELAGRQIRCPDCDAAVLVPPPVSLHAARL